MGSASLQYSRVGWCFIRLQGMSCGLGDVDVDSRVGCEWASSTSCGLRLGRIDAAERHDHSKDNCHTVLGCGGTTVSALSFLRGGSCITTFCGCIAVCWLAVRAIVIRDLDWRLCRLLRCGGCRCDSRCLYMKNLRHPYAIRTWLNSRILQRLCHCGSCRCDSRCLHMIKLRHPYVIRPWLNWRILQGLCR